MKLLEYNQDFQADLRWLKRCGFKTGETIYVVAESKSRRVKLCLQVPKRGEKKTLAIFRP